VHLNRDYGLLVTLLFALKVTLRLKAALDYRMELYVCEPPVGSLLPSHQFLLDVVSSTLLRAHKEVYI
jgi:hypothetical protein